MNIVDIRNVGLFSPSLDRHTSFYGEVWGLELILKLKNICYFRGKSSEHHILSLHRGERLGLHHLTFALEDQKNVDIAAAEIHRSGGKLLSEPAQLSEPGKGYGFRFLDPENRCIELSSGVAAHKETPFDLLKPLRLCHVVLNSKHFEECVNFYTNILGFRISDWSENQMVFLRCNSKHHVVSFNRCAHSSVNHVAYMMENVDSVMRGLGNLRRQAIRTDWGPGRHGPGNNVFYYYEDPLGYVSEYTSNMDHIENESEHEAAIWQRLPEHMDQWGVASPPSAAIRMAMTGCPDPGWSNGQ